MSTNEWKKQHDYIGKYYRKYRGMILEYYSNICNNCGLHSIKLCIDHVYNDGYKDRYNTDGGHTYYKKLWNQIEAGYPDHFQLLCYKCHYKKHHTVTQ